MPIERRYSRSESRLGSTVRSSSGLRAGAAASAASGSTLDPFAGRLGEHDFDALLDQVSVKLLHLMVGKFQLVDPRGQLFARYEATFVALSDQPA